MSHIFSMRESEALNAWYSSSKGRLIAELQWGLMERLLRPLAGERLLDVGCGPGHHLALFKEMGLQVAGVDPSWPSLNIAKNRLGRDAELRHGYAEDLAYSDNEFDIVCLITSLEFVEDPLKALAEAARVARTRVLVGCLNNLALTALYRRARSLVRRDVYSRATFFNIYEIKSLFSDILGKTKIRWGSTPTLPVSFIGFTRALEALPLMQKSPFGAFIALVCDTTPKMRATMSPVKAEQISGRPEPARRARLEGPLQDSVTLQPRVHPPREPRQTRHEVFT